MRHSTLNRIPSRSLLGISVFDFDVTTLSEKGEELVSRRNIDMPGMNQNGAQRRDRNIGAKRSTAILTMQFCSSPVRKTLQVLNASGIPA